MAMFSVATVRCPICGELHDDGVMTERGYICFDCADREAEQQSPDIEETSRI